MLVWGEQNREKTQTRNLLYLWRKSRGEIVEIGATEHKVQPLFYRTRGYKYCEISFDGIKFYTFKIENVRPHSWTKKMDYIILYTDNDMIKCDGYYNRVERIIVFYENRKVYNLYRGIIQRQKMERTNQRFLLTGDEIRRKERMSVKDMEELASGRVDLEDAPKLIYPVRIETERKEDKDEKECLYANFFWEEKGTEVSLTQKYTPFHISALLKRMKFMKIKNIGDWVGPEHPWRYETEVFKGIGYPKYMPVQPEE